jgi:hypothetical protein
MIPASVAAATRPCILAAMDATRPTLPQRVTAVLHAREYVVFFSIGLFALDTAVPILSAGMRLGGPFKDVMYEQMGALADAVAARSLLIAAVFAGYVLLMSWLRAGYIRSLVGRLHLRPAGRRQFLNLLGLELILEVVGALGAGAMVLAGENVVVLNLVAFAVLGFYFVVLYADYILVLGDVGPLRSVVLSWRMVRLTLLPSAAILLVVTLLGQLVGRLMNESAVTSVGRALPMLLVQCVLMGAVIFVADVTLVVLYRDAVERGRLKIGRPGVTAAGEDSGSGRG